MSAKKDCTRFEELLISRCILKDISKTNDKKLETHLKKCESCRQREKDLLFLNTASRNIPEMKPSRKFEKNLYKILDIPPLVKEKKKSRLLSLFRIESGMTFLKPAAAFLSIIFVQAVLLRVYFLPPGDKAPARHSVPMAAAKRDLSVKSGSFSAAGRLKSFLGGYKINAEVSAKVETKTYFKKVRLKEKTVRKERNFIGFNNTTVFAQKKPTRRALKSAMKSTDIHKNLDDLTSAYQMKKADNIRKKQINKKSSGTTSAGSANAGGKSLKGTSENNIKPGEKNPALTKSFRRKSSLKDKFPAPQSDQEKTTKKEPSKLVKKSRKIVTITLKTTGKNRAAIQKADPAIRRRIRKIYGKTADVRIRYAYNMKQDRNDYNKTLESGRDKHGHGYGYLIMMLIMLLEATVRVLLLVDLKRSGRLSLPRGLAAVFLGTLYLPVYLIVKSARA